MPYSTNLHFFVVIQSFLISHETSLISPSALFLINYLQMLALRTCPFSFGVSTHLLHLNLIILLLVLPAMQSNLLTKFCVHLSLITKLAVFFIKCLYLKIGIWFSQLCPSHFSLPFPPFQVTSFSFQFLWVPTIWNLKERQVNCACRFL